MMQAINAGQTSTPSTAILKKGFALNWYKKPEIDALPLTPIELSKAAGLDWGLNKREMLYKSGRPDLLINVADKFALVNSKYGSVHGIVSKDYTPTQPYDMLTRGLDVCNKLNLEPVGSGYDSGRAYLIADTGADWSVAGGQRKTLLTLTFGLNGKTSDSANFMDVNLSCWNMLHFLVSSSLKGLTYDHRGKVDDKQDKLFDILYKGLDGIKLEKKQRAKLAEVTVTQQEAIQLLVDALNLGKRLQDRGDLPRHVTKVLRRFGSRQATIQGGGMGNSSMHDLLECFTFESANVRGSDDSRIWRNINGTFANENTKVYRHLRSVA